MHGHGGPMGGRGPMGGPGGHMGGRGPMGGPGGHMGGRGPMGGPGGHMGGPGGGRPPMPPRRFRGFGGGYRRGCGCLPGCMMYVLGIGAIIAFVLSLIF